jgi:hypothetical protein
MEAKGLGVASVSGESVPSRVRETGRETYSYWRAKSGPTAYDYSRFVLFVKGALVLILRLKVRDWKFQEVTGAFGAAFQPRSVGSSELGYAAVADLKIGHYKGIRKRQNPRP